MQGLPPLFQVSAWLARALFGRVRRRASPQKWMGTLLATSLLLLGEAPWATNCHSHFPIAQNQYLTPTSSSGERFTLACALVHVGQLQEEKASWESLVGGSRFLYLSQEQNVGVAGLLEGSLTLPGHTLSSVPMVQSFSRSPPLHVAFRGTGGCLHQSKP